METLKLSEIVLSVTPELYPFLKNEEKDLYIVLKNGLSALREDDVLEIIQYSISEQKGRDALLH